MADDIGVAVLGGEEERCLAPLIEAVHLRAVHEELLHSLHVPVARREVQGRAAVGVGIVDHVRLSPLLEQRSHHLRVPLLCRHQHRRASPRRPHL